MRMILYAVRFYCWWIISHVILFYRNSCNTHTHTYCAFKPEHRLCSLVCCVNVNYIFTHKYILIWFSAATLKGDTNTCDRCGARNPSCEFSQNTRNYENLKAVTAVAKKICWGNSIEHVVVWCRQQKNTCL